MTDSPAAAPVLPWGRVEAAETKPSPTEEDPPAAGLPLTDVGLAAGQKIEVRWQVDVEMETAEDPGDSNTAAEATEAAAAEGKQQTKIQSSVRWWGATVRECTDDSAGTSLPGSGPVFEILYEADGAFEEECCKVRFTGPHSLFDPEKQLDLDWRVAGDTWEPEVESDDEGEEEGGAAEQGAGGEAEQGALPDHAMTSSEILTILDENQLQSAENQFMQNLEPAKRLQVAAAYREFADGFKNFLEHKFAAQGDGAKVVSAEDVHAFAEQLRAKRPRIS